MPPKKRPGGAARKKAAKNIAGKQLYFVWSQQNDDDQMRGRRVRPACQSIHLWGTLSFQSLGLADEEWKARLAPQVNALKLVAPDPQFVVQVAAVCMQDAPRAFARDILATQNVLSKFAASPAAMDLIRETGGKLPPALRLHPYIANEIFLNGLQNGTHITAHMVLTQKTLVALGSDGSHTLVIVTHRREVRKGIVS